MSDNKIMKTPEPPKMTFVDINALKSANCSSLHQRKQLRKTEESASKLCSTKTMNSTSRFRTPSSTTAFYSKPTFGTSTSKQMSKSEDLQARLKRLEDSGLLRKIREGLHCVDEDDVDDDNQSDTGFKCTDVNSNQDEKSSNQVKVTLNTNVHVNKYTDAMKCKKWMNTNEAKTAKDLKCNESVHSGTNVNRERSLMKHSKSEPEINTAKSCDEIDSVKSIADTHKTTESKQTEASAVVKASSTSNLPHNKESELKSFKVNDKTYFKLNKIGQGGSSHVYQVYEPQTQKTLALKVVDLSKVDDTTRKGFMNEIKLLSRLRNCERVVKLYDYCKLSSNQLIVIMEKGDSDLGSILRQFVETKNKYSLDPHVIKHYWKEMLKAVDEIHKLDIVHSDLKPVNFISVGGKLKLIDFGIANAIDNDNTSVIKDNQIGTVNYMAPESLKQWDTNPGRKLGKPLYRFNCKADIWSLGCILYNLVYGRAPFAHLTSLISKIQAICDPKFAIEYPSYENHLVIDCIKLCLNRDPQKRATAEQLLKHAFLKDSGCSSPSEPGLNEIYTKIHNLTPNRIHVLSKVITSLSQNK